MTRALVKNASDAGQVKEAGKKENALERQKKDDLEAVLSTREGRRWMWSILSACGVFTNPADPSGSWTYFNCGKLEIGLALQKDVAALFPETYFTMMREAQAEARVQKQEIDEEIENEERDE